MLCQLRPRSQALVGHQPIVAYVGEDADDITVTFHCDGMDVDVLLSLEDACLLVKEVAEQVKEMEELRA